MSKTNENPISNLSIKDNKIGDFNFPPGNTLEVKFEDGKKEGDGIVYSPLRVKLARLHYHQDLLHGFCVFNNERGKKICECVYENGIRNGWIREYKDDKIIYTGICQNGEKVSELRNYNGKSDFVEEIQNNKRISIRKFNSDLLGGICYCYENDKVKQVYRFQCGEKNKMMYEFDNSKMIEYDINEMVVYVGEYEGNIENGYKRKGKGEVYVYKNSKIYEIDHINNGNKTGYEILDGNMMKQYENNQLKYEGGWYMKEREVCYNGEGFVYSSSSEYYKAVFDKGREVRRLMNVKDNEMTLFDNEAIVYKGGFGNGYVKKGRGKRYEYKKGILKRVIVCENGNDVYKWIEIEGNKMTEYNENGLIVYIGGFNNNGFGGILRNGEGSLLDKNQLIFTGNWKNGKREGNGSYYQNSELVYDGKWSDDKPNGQGKYYNSEGDVLWEGNWKNGYGNMGNGVWLYYEDGRKCVFYENGNVKYEGEWKDGKPNGRGILFYENGNKKYEGEWKNGLIEIENGIWFDYTLGQPVLTDMDGNTVYTGVIENGLPNGNGQLMKNGNVVYEGEWNDGFLQINNSVYIEIEDGFIYVNELQNSGLFGCFKRMKRQEINTIGEITVNTWEKLLGISIGVTELIIAEGCGNEVKEDLRICNYPLLKKLIVKKNSLKNLNSLIISNNSELESIVTEDGQPYNSQSKTFYAPFENARSLTLSSIF